MSSEMHVPTIVLNLNIICFKTNFKLKLNYIFCQYKYLKVILAYSIIYF